MTGRSLRGQKKPSSADGRGGRNWAAATSRAWPKRGTHFNLRATLAQGGPAWRPVLADETRLAARAVQRRRGPNAALLLRPMGWGGQHLSLDGTYTSAKNAPVPGHPKDPPLTAETTATAGTVRFITTTWIRPCKAQGAGAESALASDQNPQEVSGKYPAPYTRFDEAGLRGIRVPACVRKMGRGGEFFFFFLFGPRGGHRLNVVIRAS